MLSRLIIVLVMLASTSAYAADLPKLRNIPVSIPGLPADVIRQYEFNPDIGPYGTRNLKVTSVQSSGQQVSGNAVWGIDSTLNGIRVVAIYIYRGFATLTYTSNQIRSQCGSLPDTSVPTTMKLVKNGPWPSPAFKIYLETADESYDITCGYYKDGRRQLVHQKKLIECVQERFYTMERLPGKVYAYSCDQTASADYEGANPTTTRGTRYLYSDYLDMVIATRVPGIDEATGRYQVTFNFTGPTGAAQSVEVDNYRF